MGDEKVLKDMGLRVSARRKELHLTQEQVSEQMDVSVQMISNLELGRKAIRPENLIMLCDVLDISADYILTGRDVCSELSGIIGKLSRLSQKQQKLIEMVIDEMLV